MPKTAINYWKADLVLSYFVSESTKQLTVPGKLLKWFWLACEYSRLSSLIATTYVSKRRSIAARSKETVAFADLGLESEVLNLMSSTI